MVQITFIESDGTECVIETSPGVSLMTAAVHNNIRGIDADCGGALACATCHVHVDAAWIQKVGSPSEMETSLLDFAEDVTDQSRLSCQIEVTEPLNGLVVGLPSEA